LDPEIYHWRGETWHKIDGALRHITVAEDGSILGCNAAHEIWWRQGEVGSTWMKMPGLLVMASVHKWGKHIWGVNAAGEIWTHSEVQKPKKTRETKQQKTVSRFTSVAWQQMPGKLRQVASSKYGIYGVNDNADIFQWTGANWEKLSGAARHISVGADGSVWVCNDAHEIFRYIRDAKSWEKMPGRLVQLSVARNNSVIGVNESQDIFHWNGSSWQQLPGKAVWAATNERDEFWVVNEAQEVFYWANNKWHKIDGALMNISVTKEGAVIGCNAQGQIWTRQGPSGTWKSLPGAAINVSAVNKKILVCCNSARDVFRMQ
jgi:virginiamycin B lyase